MTSSWRSGVDAIRGEAYESCLPSESAYSVPDSSLPRECVKTADPLAPAGHPLAVAHRELWEAEVQAKFRRLFQKNG